jgi:hypothetical protein
MWPRRDTRLRASGDPLVEHQQQEAVNVMCGICGLVWFDPAKPVDACMVDRMMSTLVHRGPNRLWPSQSLRKLRLPAWLLMASLRDQLFDDSVYATIEPDFRASREALLATYDRLRPQLEPLSPINAYFAGLAASIPPYLRCAGGTPKHIFREEIRGKLPPFIMAHPKRGFGMPPSYHNVQSWHDAIARLRRENPLLESMIDFGGQSCWSGGLSWHVLYLGTWLAHRSGASLPC